ncbi:GDP-L-fucose synthase family protein [Marinibaculum pumilum]|uniref:GDP-L-fucose synthase n=1 Tax=Marinibaculum pumilum TaxID=1766165 RepID=A0ABV7L2F3_9PROT
MAEASAFPVAGQRIWVAGHRGMVGSAVCRALRAAGAWPLTVDRADLDLTQAVEVAAWLRRERPDGIIVAAGRVAGIAGNAAHPASMMQENLMIAHSVIWGAHQADVARLAYLGASCVYPRDAAQPIAEESLLTGPLEPTNEGYALAKIAGMRLCAFLRQEFGRRYVSLVPANLYGRGDRAHADPDRAHVIPALMGRMLAARQAGAAEVEIWGTGKAVRDFLYVDDAAEAILLAYERFAGPGHLNIGSGSGTDIATLAGTIAEVTGFRGALRFDGSKPDGMPRKVLDSRTSFGLGWRPTTALVDGLRLTLQDLLAQAPPA